MAHKARGPWTRSASASAFVAAALLLALFAVGFHTHPLQSDSCHEPGANAAGHGSACTICVLGTAMAVSDTITPAVTEHVQQVTPLAAAAAATAPAVFPHISPGRSPPLAS